MSTYKPKGSSIFLYDFQINGRRFHGSTKQKSKRAADKVEELIRLEAMTGGPKRKKIITLDEAAGLYEIKLTKDGKWSKSTEGWIMNLVTTIGATRFIHDIEQSDLADFYRARGAIVSGSSVNREVDVARAIWRYTQKSKYEIGEMPDWGSMRYAVKEHDPRELTYGEEDRLIEHLREDYRPFVQFALMSGWRCAEVRLLRWKDLDYPAKQAWSTIKGGNRVRRPLTSAMIAHIASQPVCGPFVFTYECQKTRLGRKKGERYPISKDGWRKVWGAALEAGEVDAARFHDLRHTKGTRMLRATGNLKAVQAGLKHKNIKTTLRYAHVLDEDVRIALEASESRNIPDNHVDIEEKSRNSAA
jgi:integrase